MKKITSLLLFVIIIIIFAGSVNASEFDVKCDERKCTPSNAGKFFDKEVLWYPTYSEMNRVTITNKGDVDQFIGHRAFNIAPSSNQVEISEVLDLVIIRESVSKVVWKSTLKDFYKTDEAVLGVLGPGKTDSFTYTITMNKDAGNQYQGKSTQFDLMFGFFMPTVTPTPTLTPTPSPISTITPTPGPTTLNSRDLETSDKTVGEVQGVSDTRKMGGLIETLKFNSIEIYEKFIAMTRLPTPIRISGGIQNDNIDAVSQYTYSDRGNNYFLPILLGVFIAPWIFFGYIKFRLKK
ncbi:hypothetical protein COV58_02095 [Candidatus Roizmanbacteria bacterium CG11_big_fil_rev_8_21_14_0_20_36_8]|uniref:Uncharacterized protein n=2 Tax=Candidatus Roizmaniibacteriota TaxID=1752723 RepID=A0A2M6IUC4_9BACT|nr:MAG: hypothetical protein COV58_02095 [Candidatus Roizmanbacteria bacterium CG11_big_fil_rev_8_21_14_0_20_36_8]PIZ65490.1 MAG: hypothetical protein COY14_02165 [Candidatus Roizmanbacteria bacterium CG_4_10_14_0_2_um_filter_36_9]